VRSLTEEEIAAQAVVTPIDVPAANAAWRSDARPDARSLLEAGEVPESPPADR
jgi:hypothetical protein